MAIEITKVIQFGDVTSTDSLVVFELDDERNVETGSDGETQVKSSFRPGDDIYLSLHTSPQVIVENVVATSGTVQYLGDDSRDKEEEFTFASRDALNPDIKTLSCIPVRSTIITYLGRTGFLTKTRSSTNNTVSYTGDTTFTPFLAKFEYSYNTGIYRLSTPNVELEEDESYPITIVAYLTLPSETINNGCNS